MFGSLTDFVLHGIILVLTYIFFGILEVKVYFSFIVLNFICTTLVVGDYFQLLHFIPKFIQSVLSSLLSLLLFVPLFDVTAKKFIKTNESDLILIKSLLDNNDTYLSNSFCQLGCSHATLEKIQLTKTYWLHFWEASLTTLYWDAPPFAWFFFGITLLISIRKWLISR